MMPLRGFEEVLRTGFLFMLQASPLDAEAVSESRTKVSVELLSTCSCGKMVMSRRRVSVWATHLFDERRLWLSDWMNGKQKMSRRCRRTHEEIEQLVAEFLSS